eukprot:14555156-Heterocapsa_arctica.AAC.1
MQFSSLLAWRACRRRPTHSRKSVREAALKQRCDGLAALAVGDLASEGAAMANLASAGPVQRLPGGRDIPVGAEGAASGLA